VELETERLRLEPLGHEHAEAITPVIGDQRIADTTSNIPYPYTEQDAHDFADIIERSEGKTHAWVMLRRVDGVLVGGCGLHDFKGTECEFGYWVGVDHWGKGYATEATVRLLRHAFESLGITRIHACYFLRNPPSRRVMEKAGLTPMVPGTFDGTLRCPNGREEAIGRMELTREEWLAANGG
jgi:RimJ/RimL family protein N-acetyltransferase